MNFFRHRKKQNNRKGVVLVTVVMVMSVAFILIGAIMSFVQLNTTQTMRNYKKQQAFMTASTYLESFVSEIERQTTVTASDPTSTDYQNQMLRRKNYINQLNTLANNGTSTKNVTVDGQSIQDKNMGELEISLKRLSTDNISITAKCNYKGETDQCSVHIYLPANAKKGPMENAIEYTGSGNVHNNNGSVLGGVARINKGNDLDVTFNLQNDGVVSGGQFFYGNVVNKTRSNVNLQKSFDKNNEGDYTGQGFTVSRNLTVENEWSITSTMDASLGANYVNVGGDINVKNNTGVGCAVDGTNTTGSKPIDVYCTNFNKEGNFYYQNGNLYVNKLEGESASSSGNLTVKAGKMYVDGDIFVQGDLTIEAGTDKELKVTPGHHIYVDGDVTNGGTISYTDGTGDQNTIVVKAGEAGYVGSTKAPEIPDDVSGINHYQYDSGYILASGDTAAKSIKNDYSKFYGSGAITKTLKDISGGEVTIPDNISDPANTGKNLKFAKEIKESFIIDQSCINDSTKQKKYLINVTDATGNIVVLLKNGINAADADKKMMFVVKNDSSELSDGGQKYGVFFVSDSGLGSSATEENGMKKWNDMNGVNINICEWGILDYNTYLNVWDKNDLETSAYSGPKTNSDVYLNTSDYTDDELKTKNAGKMDLSTKYFFTPKKGNIHMILAGNSSLTSTGGSSSFFETEMYCIDSTIDFSSGTSNFVLNLVDADGNPLTNATGAPIVNIGKIVADNFMFQNTCYVVYNAPQTGSFWPALYKMPDTDTMGFKVLMYNYT